MKNSLKDKPQPLNRVLENVGFKPNTAKTPGRIIDGEGLQQALAEETATMVAALKKRGIDPDYVAERIERLISDPQSYKAVTSGVDFALKLGVGGGYKEVQPPNNQPIINNPQILLIIQRTDEQIKKMLMTPRNVEAPPKTEEALGPQQQD